MRWRRVLGALTAALVIAGCAVVAIGMAKAASRPHHRHRASAVPSSTPRPAYLPLTVAPSATAATPPRTTAHASSTPTSLHASAAPLALASSSARLGRAPRPASAKARTVSNRGTRRVATLVASHAAVALRQTAPLRSTHAQPTPERSAGARVRGGPLPLRLRTHHAGQVITVVARSRRSTIARLQAWHRLRGGGWVRRGPRIRAHIGADGLTWHASESKSATPMGSFTLTRAFGHHANPGTALPYLHTIPADWWISQPGRLYNTHQRCRSHCRFTRGAPNEHLYFETPYYNYAVVIDYNTRNAPGGVKQGRGSAFFLHVTVGQPTAGCVAIPQARLVSIMRWLAPRKHPRILIGVG